MLDLNKYYTKEVLQMHGSDLRLARLIDNSVFDLMTRFNACKLLLEKAVENNNLE